MCRKCYVKTIVISTAVTASLFISLPIMTWATTNNNNLDKSLQSQQSNSWWVSTANAKEKRASNVKWTCPMHPHYIADEFGSCPICGMDLVKLQTNNTTQDNTESEQRTEISVSPEMMQTMGVRLAKVEKSTFGRSIRSYGIVQENERLRLELSARVEGWIKKLNITAVGDKVKKGDVLFEMYSPELVISQNDYLGTLKNEQKLRSNTITRLTNFGVQKQAIEKLKADKKAMNNVPFYADQNGTVSELNVTSGSYVKRGTKIAMIQDYSTVWVIVNVSETDLGFISKNTKARVMFPNIPGKQVDAKVDYIYPTVDTRTRTGRVRLVIDNKQGKIRPGTYTDVIFEVGIEHRVSIPSESILKNENVSFVVVSLGKGRFEPRAIQLGLNSGKWSEVKSGLKTGEEIVVSGQFLLDSESALRESFRKLERLQLPLSLLKPSKNEFAMIDHMVDAALYIHEALVDGYDIQKKFLAPAVSIKHIMWPKYKNTKLAFVLKDAERALKKAQAAKTESELKRALNSLLIALKPWLTEGAPNHYKNRKVVLFEENVSGLLWIQTNSKPFNPYGKKQARIIPWNINKTAQETSKQVEKKDEKKNEMRGSHRGSHGG